MVQFRAATDRNKKADEIVSGLVGLVKKEGDIVVASDSKSKLCKHMSLKRAIQDWNMKYVDVVGSPGLALRVFTSSERLTNHLKINEIGEVGKLVTKIEMDSPEIAKIGEADRDGCSENRNIAEGKGDG